MRGVVEIYEDGVLIESSPNLWVDGSRKLMVDIMTAPGDLINLPELSSILDASNYTIQAFSYGKDRYSFLSGYGHLQGLNTDPAIVLSAEGDTGTAGAPKEGAYLAASADHELPNEPSPFDTQLERGLSDVYGVSNYGGNIPNYLAFSAALELDASTAIRYGCYGGSSDGALTYMVSGSNGANTTQYTTERSRYNSTSSLDINGFIQAGYNVPGPLGRFQVSSAASYGYETTREIAYYTRMHADDADILDIYGGVWSIGAWTIDLKTTLNSGEQPPYIFDQINNPMKYRLFAKKVLTDNLARGNKVLHSNKDVIWRMYF